MIFSSNELDNNINSILNTKQELQDIIATRKLTILHINLQLIHKLNLWKITR